MANTREKLIELIGSVQYGNGSLIGHNFQKGFIEKIADHLIANGVTFAKDTNVLTNADRIRAMSDEELAKILGDKCICPPIGECAKMSGDCIACWLEWLQQPAEVDNG